MGLVIGRSAYRYSDEPAFGKQTIRLWFYWFSRLKYNPNISADPLLYSYYTSLDARQNKTIS
jgi:hypothetical protein